MSATPMTSLRVHPARARPAGGHGPSVTLADVAGALLRTFAVWRERARQRRVLATLDDHLLKDIGLTRLDVDQEAGKPFWRP